jgi:hypothetical protein
MHTRICIQNIPQYHHSLPVYFAQKCELWHHSLSHILCSKVWACIGYKWVQGVHASTQCELEKLLLGSTKNFALFVKGLLKWPTAIKYWTFEMDSQLLRIVNRYIINHKGYVKCTLTHLKTFAQGSVSVNEKEFAMLVESAPKVMTRLGTLVETPCQQS